MIGDATLVGKKLGAYTLQELVGQGGMSSVYRAFDERLHRPVAVKVLSEAAAMQPGLVDRFRQEALLLASLRHPHIVQVYDFGAQDGLIYMVQELLPGPTLDQRLHDLHARGERTDRETILAITSDLASALDAAHAAGIVHRDVKPANAIWNAAGALVLTDFGVAKNTLEDAAITQAGVVFGTPIYISPEQAQGLTPTPASDIYALGVLIYELIAGHPPFAEGTPMEIVFAHVQTPAPPLRPSRPDLPPAAEAVVLRALAKDPADRFGSASELASELASAWPARPADAAAPVAALPDPATAIWDKPTTVWTPPAPTHAPAAAIPAPTPVQSALPDPAPISAQAAGAPPRRNIPLIAIVALAALLLVGVAAALRGNSAGGGARPINTPANPGRPTAAAGKPSPAPNPGAPAPKPSPGQPAPKPSPIPQDNNSGDPLDQLQALFSAGSADGRAGKEGNRLLNDLAQVRQAIEKGDQQRAANKLADLRRRVQGDVRSKKIDASFAQQATADIDAIARKYGLKAQDN